MSPPLTVKVWADYACFTRPELYQSGNGDRYNLILQVCEKFSTDKPQEEKRSHQD